MMIKIMPIKATKQFKENHLVNCKTAFIYVLNYDDVVDEKNILCDTELWLNFNDITDEKRIDAMKSSHAVKIKEFVLSLDADIKMLIVCCSAGMSRSPAIAAGILKGLGCSDMHIWKNPSYSPNKLCYQMMLKVFGKNTLFAHFKKYINNGVFRKTIKRSRVKEPYKVT